MVRHSSQTASISTTMPVSFSALRDEPIQPMQPYAQIMPAYGGSTMGYGQQQPPPPPSQHMMQGYGVPGYSGKLFGAGEDVFGC